MSHYECSRIEDAAGYVLRALPEGEWESYRYHVAECEQCEEKVSELDFVSHAMLSAAPQLSAPPDIRNRVMYVVRAESELLKAAGAGADRPPSRTSRARLGFGFARLRPLTAGALAAVLLALGLGVGTTLNQGSSCANHAGRVDPSAGSRATAKLIVCDGNTTLALSGMNAAPPGRTWQVWVDDPKLHQGPEPGMSFSVRSGKASVAIENFKGGKTVLVTNEPPGGSQVPTRTPVVKAST